MLCFIGYKEYCEYHKEDEVRYYTSNPLYAVRSENFCDSRSLADIFTSVDEAKDSAKDIKTDKQLMIFDIYGKIVGSDLP